MGEDPRTRGRQVCALPSVLLLLTLCSSHVDMLLFGLFVLLQSDEEYDDNDAHNFSGSTPQTGSTRSSTHARQSSGPASHATRRNSGQAGGKSPPKSPTATDILGPDAMSLPFLKTPQAKRVYRLLNRKLPVDLQRTSQPSGGTSPPSNASAGTGGGGSSDVWAVKKGGGDNLLAQKQASVSGKQLHADDENERSAGGRPAIGTSSRTGPRSIDASTGRKLRAHRSQPARARGGLKKGTLAAYGSSPKLLRAAAGSPRRRARGSNAIQLPSLDHDPVIRPQSVDKGHQQPEVSLAPIEARQVVSQQSARRLGVQLDAIDAKKRRKKQKQKSHGGDLGSGLRADWLKEKQRESKELKKAHKEIEDQLWGIPTEFMKQYRDEHGTQVEGKPAGLNVTIHGIEEDMARNALQRMNKIFRRLRKAQVKRAWFVWRRHTKHQRKLANESSAAESAKRFALNIFLRIGRRFDRRRMRRRLKKWHKLAMRAKAREERAAAIMIQKSYRAAKAVGAIEWQRRLVLYRTFHRHKREVKVLYFAYIASKHRARRRARLLEERRRWHQRFIMHLAAVRLQRAFHGYRARKKAKLRRFLFDVASLIQRNLRAFLWRIKNKDIWADLRKVAPKIQKTIRGLWARRKFRIRWQARQEWRRKQDRVQRNWHRLQRRYIVERRHLAAHRRYENSLIRRRMRLRTSSAIKIQKLSRGYVARRRLRRALPEEYRLVEAYAEAADFLVRVWRRELERRWWRANYQIKRTAMIRRAKIAQGQNRKWVRTYPEIYVRNFGDVMDRRPEELCLWEVIKMEHVVLVVGPDLAALAIQGLVRRCQAMLLKEAMLRQRTRPFVAKIQVLLCFPLVVLSSFVSH